MRNSLHALTHFVDGLRSRNTESHVADGLTVTGEAARVAAHLVQPR